MRSVCLIKSKKKTFISCLEHKLRTPGVTEKSPGVTEKTSGVTEKTSGVTGGTTVLL